MPNTSEKIADNVILLILARLSMVASLPALGLVAYLFNANLEQKFSAQDKAIAAQATASENQSRVTVARVETVERTAQSAIDQAGAVNNRLSIVETKQTENAIANERFQAATLQRLDRLQDSAVSMSNSISALTAVIQSALQEKQNRSP